MWDLIVSVPDHCLSFYFAFEVVVSGRVNNIVSFILTYSNISIRLCTISRGTVILKITTSTSAQSDQSSLCVQ